MKRRLLALSIAALSIGYQTSHHARQTAAMEVIYRCSASGAPAASPAPSAIRALEGTAHGFEANQGQTGDRVRYLARGPGYTLFLAPDEAVLVLRDAAKSEGRIGKDAQGPRARSFRATRVVRMRLIGGNPKTRLVGDGEMSGRSNYLIGRDRNNWRRGIPRYARVRYEEVYPGVDLVFYGTEGQLEYDLVVAPGADAGVVRVAFEGADALRLDEEGNLLLTVGSGRIVQRAPLLHQDLGGIRSLVAGRHVLRGPHEVAFSVDSVYDRARPLVIDPVLSYSTYLGGSIEDVARGIAVDATGAVYVAGESLSLDFPTRGARQPTRSAPYDAFVTKLTPGGNELAYSTYLGGNNSDQAYGIAVDYSGSAYVTGSTYSTDFPAVNALQPTLAGSCDAFVVKLDSAGSALAYSTYLGGTGVDEALAISVNSSGAAYVAGYTWSPDFPAVNALQLTLKDASGDAFITKLTPAGDKLLYSTYLGGNKSDKACGIAVDSTGSAYVTGTTYSTDFPVVRAWQPALAGGSDAFVLKLDPAGSALAYSTYLGGRQSDSGLAIATDGAGNAYVTGETLSLDFPLANPLRQTNSGMTDAFVTKLSPMGTTLVYSTYLGGSSMETGSAIAVDSGGRAYVAGRTNSGDFPVVRPLGPLQGGTDAFVVKLIPTGDALVYSTPLGGSVSDDALAVALDVAGNAYVTGETESSDFQTLNPFQPNNRGRTGNAFVARLTDDAQDPAPIPRPGSGRVEQDDPAVGLSGTWYTNAGAGHSGGSAAFAEMQNSRAVFTFSGTGVKWIGLRDEWSGIARVSLDGVFKGTVDTYASPAESQAVLFATGSLAANGPHTLVVETTGASNASSGGAWIWVDAFEVIP